MLSVEFLSSIFWKISCSPDEWEGLGGWETDER